jgi:N-acetylneuraminic acid mutarotase
MAVDLFIVEGEIIDETRTAGYEAVFLDKNNEVIKKIGAKYIAGNQVNDPMNKKALENYPDLPVSQKGGIGTLKESGKVTLMYMLFSDEADKAETVLLYYIGHGEKPYKSDVLKIEID